MADSGHWFKLWTGVLDDPKLQELSLEDFARWCIFGTFLKKHGNAGTIVIPYPASILQRLFRLVTVDDVIVSLSRFPNCKTDVKKSDDSVTSHIEVTWQNWHKYQVDSSAGRMQKHRRNVTFQKRREEKRIRSSETAFSSTSKPLAGPYGG